MACARALKLVKRWSFDFNIAQFCQTSHLIWLFIRWFNAQQGDTNVIYLIKLLLKNVFEKKKKQTQLHLSHFSSDISGVVYHVCHNPNVTKVVRNWLLKIKVARSDSFELWTMRQQQRVKLFTPNNLWLKKKTKIAIFFFFLLAIIS